MAREWIALDCDPDRLSEARKGTRTIIRARLTEALIGRWGQAEYRNIQAFRRLREAV